MNKQAIFDRVATHLLRQGVQSMDPDGRCRYFGPDGTRCALGALMDESFQDRIPNVPLCRQQETGSIRFLYAWPWSDDAIKNALASSLKIDVDDLPLPLLHSLQDLHDLEPPESWRRSLVRVARTHDLSTRVLEAA